MAPTFSIVIPTYRRSALLRRMLPSYLCTGALEVIVVDDGSGPGDRPALEAVAAEPGVRVIHGPHRGLPAARNEGVEQAKGEWVVFGEDDAWFTAEYPATLVDHAVRARAAVASGYAPLIDPSMLSRPKDELEEVIRSKPMADRPPDEFLGVAWPVERLDSGDILTPLLTAGAAIHGSVFERIRFDESFRGNAFREESDFFLSCFEAGIRMIRCPHAKCGHMKVHSRAAEGGAWSMGRPRYTFHMMANNWRLVRKHRVVLRAARLRAGRRGGPIRMQLEFVGSLLRRTRPVSA
jgi:glycosyltransferase involved in cell wall biosynthesis